MAERFRYLRRFVAAPGRIGSVAPSSPSLTRAMLRFIDWPRVDVVAELGAGTGVFTQAIEAVRPPTSSFLVFEQERSLRAQLHRRFPSAQMHADAKTLRGCLERHHPQGADCIISGLPFANFRPADRGALLADIHAALRPGGIFVAFQYSLQLRRQLRDCFGNLDIELVLRNVPPAVVYRCSRGVPFDGRAKSVPAVAAAGIEEAMRATAREFPGADITD